MKDERKHLIVGDFKSGMWHSEVCWCRAGPPVVEVTQEQIHRIFSHPCGDPENCAACIQWKAVAEGRNAE